MAKVILLYKLFIFLNYVYTILAVDDFVCAKNRTIWEVPGDAVITVFIDVNEGPYCNETSLKGLQEMSAAVHVVQILNKYHYVPDMSIGLRIFDTCHDKVVVYKQALTALAALDCTINYELSILVSESRAKVLRPFVNYSMLQINYYPDLNLSFPLIEATLNFISGKFEIIDLLLTSPSISSAEVLQIAREFGICIKNHETITDVRNSGDIVVLAIGYWDDIRSWIKNFDDKQKVTWIALSTDDIYDEEAMPTGSYYIKSEPVDSIDDNFSSALFLEDYINATKRAIMHSPYLLNLGKYIVQISKSLRHLRERLCTEDNCLLPPFNGQLEQVSIAELYEALHVAEEIRYVKYSIIKKFDENEYLKVIGLKLGMAGSFQAESGSQDKMPQLCVGEAVASCVGKCANFPKLEKEMDVVRAILRPNEWVAIYLTIAYCGTFTCVVIAAFIVYHYFTEEIIDGSPTLTIVLVFANILLMQTVFPFCMDDEFAGPEHLNSRKIFVTTLSFGLLFSIILSRAFFLAFSTGNMLTSHINGYLQSLMIFFMAGVQVAISTMYFLLSDSDSAVVVRSLMFIALLSYDIFLLIALFIICCFIAQVQRNYREGKCFFGTVIGLLIVWAIWLTSFILVEPEVRDIIVCFGIVSTSLFVIIGILIPRTYYMVTHLRRDKMTEQRFGPTDFGPVPRMNNIARQYQQPFYEYIRPREGITGFSTLPVESLPNYYGTSSPSARYFDRTRLPEPRTSSAYSNYGFHSEMREMENAYTVPQVCIENTEGYKSHLSKSDVRGSYRQRQSRKPKLILREKDSIQTDIYVEDRKLSPTRRGPNESYPSRCSSPKLDHVDSTIQEEDEYEESNRTTKF